MPTTDKLIEKKAKAPRDPREAFFIDFVEYTLNQSKVDFAQSWIDRDGSMYNRRWRQKMEKSPDICILLSVTERSCRCEIMFHNKMKEDNLTTYLKKLFEVIESDKEKYSAYFDDVTEMGVEQLKRAPLQKYLMVNVALKRSWRIAFYTRIGFKDTARREEAFLYLYETYKILDALFLQP